MTDRDDKSLDDVLASIRRIVRADKETSVANAPGQGPHAQTGGQTGGRPDAEEPLVLTPEMRTDAGAGRARVRPELAADMAAQAGEAPPGGNPLDRQALREALRELLLEELSGGPAQEALRGIVREELTAGELGRNISRNVHRLIRDEVARAVQAPR